MVADPDGLAPMMGGGSGTTGWFGGRGAVCVGGMVLFKSVIISVMLSAKATAIAAASAMSTGRGGLGGSRGDEHGAGRVGRVSRWWWRMTLAS